LHEHWNETAAFYEVVFVKPPKQRWVDLIDGRDWQGGRRRSPSPADRNLGHLLGVSILCLSKLTKNNISSIIIKFAVSKVDLLQRS